MSPINPGERFPEPSAPAKAAVIVQHQFRAHRQFLALVAAFVLGAVFGAK